MLGAVASHRASIELGSNDDNRRADRVVKKLLREVPSGRIFRAFRNGDIRINGRRTHPDDRVHTGDELTLTGPLAAEYERHLASPSGKRQRDGDSRLSNDHIILQNSHVLAINKQRGELVHGPGSLEDAVRRVWVAQGGEESGVSFSPGPIHRLDRNTTGLLLFALSTAGAQAGSELFAEGAIEKSYLGLVRGFLRSEAVWTEALVRDRSRRQTMVARHDDPDRKSARTTATPLASGNDATIVRFTIGSGRTHQIRSHAAAHGYPLIGDAKYGERTNAPYVLHAARLSLAQEHPVLGFGCLSAPLPSATRAMLERFVSKAAVQEALRKLRCR
jgi:23S rRNA pseudouridine955/2504/2580 synthase